MADVTTTVRQGFNRTRFYQIRAVNSVSPGIASDSRRAITATSRGLLAIATGPATYLLGTPTAPFRVAVTGLSGAITYRWQRRPASGGAWVDDGTVADHTFVSNEADTYQVRCIASRSGDSATSNIVTVTHTRASSGVEALRAAVNQGYGATKHYQVRARNALAAGPASDAADATTGAAPLARPGPVRNLAESATTQNSITWGWDAPNTGGAVASYEYRTALSSGSFSGSWTTTGTVRSVTVGSLTAGTAYKIQVRARNAGGTGTAATDSASTAAASTVTVTVAVDDATPTNGDTVTFTATVGGTASGAITYQWQEFDAPFWLPINGATSRTYDRTESSAGTVTVRCRATRGGVTATSAQVSATWSASTGPVDAVAPTVTINAVAAGDEGTTVRLTATVSGGVYDDIEYGWAVLGGELDDASLASPTWTRPWVDANENVDIELNVFVLGDGTRAVDGTTASVDAATRTATVRNIAGSDPIAKAPTLSIGDPGDVAENTNPTLTVTPTGGTYDTIEYAWSIVSGGGTLTGPTGASTVYNPPDVSRNTNVTVRCIATVRGTGTDAQTGTSASAGDTVTFRVTPVIAGTNRTIAPAFGTGTITGGAITGAAPTLATTDTTAPTFVSGESNTAGTLLTFTFSEALDTSSVPALAALTMLFSGTRKSGGGITIVGNEVRVTFNIAFAHDDVITVAYTKPSTNPLQDAAGNEVASFAATAVTNNVPVSSTNRTIVPSFATGTVVGGTIAGAQPTLVRNRPIVPAFTTGTIVGGTPTGVDPQLARAPPVQVITLVGSWYRVQSFGFQWNPPIASRPQINASIAGETPRYLENIVFRRDASAVVLNIAADQSSQFSQGGNLRLLPGFETNGRITLNFNEGGVTPREWSIDMAGRDTDEPYRIDFTAGSAEDTAYDALAGTGNPRSGGWLPTTANIQLPATLRLEILDTATHRAIAPAFATGTIAGGTITGAQPAYADVHNARTIVPAFGTGTVTGGAITGADPTLATPSGANRTIAPAFGTGVITGGAIAGADPVRAQPTEWTTELEAGWYLFASGAVKRWQPGDDERPEVPAFLRRPGTTAFLENVAFRLDRYGFLLHFNTEASGSAFAGNRNVDLTADFETRGRATVAFDDSGTTRSFTVNMGSDASEPYDIAIPAADQAAFDTFRDALASGNGLQAATLTLDFRPLGTARTIAPAFATGAIVGGTITGADPTHTEGDRTAPAFSSAETNEDGTTVTLTFDEALDTGNVPAASAFTLSPAKAISDVAVSGSTVVLTTAAFATDDTITVAYTKPSANPLQDAAGNEVATFAAQSVSNRVPAGPPPLGRLLLDITLPVVFNTGAAGQWSGNGLVPASVLRDQDTAGNISVAVTETATDFLININVPRFTAALEDGVVGIELADGTRLATFTLDGTWSAGLTRYDIVAPDDGLTAAEVQAVLGVGRASLVFKIGEGGIRLIGVGEAAFAAFPAADLDSTSPTARRFAGIGEAQFTVPPAATLTLTGPTAVRFAGIGEAAFNFPTATLSNTEAQKIVGVGEAEFAAFPAADLTRIIKPERFAGIGEAAFRAFADAELTVTPPGDVRFRGLGRARFQGPPAATLTRNVPRRFAGIGQAAFAFPAATLSVINPTARRFAGIGEAAFAAFPPATLTLTAPTARLFTGIGTASFAAFPAAALSNNPARFFAGIGQAAFSTFPAAQLDVPTPLAPADVDEYSARQARDLQGDEPRLALEITHPDITTPIRIVADNRDHIIEGNNYIALAFRGSPPQIREGESPRAIFEIDNVGREMLQWVEATGGGRGAAARVLLVHADPATVLSHIAWELPSVSVGTAEITNETIQMQLVFRSGRSRPGIKWKFDPVSSPGIF